MSLETARQALFAALTAADIDTYYGWGTFSAPCARIFPAEPWVTLSGLAGGKRTQRWEVWAIAGRTDAGAAYEDLESLVQSINNAIVGLKGFAYPEWRRPALTDMGGARYIASRGIIETLMEV